MDNPGKSLFQGSDDLQLGGLQTEGTRQEEEEAEEDHKRREEELHDLLANAFDDFLDNDDDDLSTLNSSHSHYTEPDDQGTWVDNLHLFTMDNKISSSNQIPTSNANPINEPNVNGTAEQYPNLLGAGDSPQVSKHYTHCFRTSPFEGKDYNSKEQLEALYEMRCREVKQLAEELEQFKITAAKEKDNLYRKYAVSEAEKERVKLLFSEGVRQVESGKQRISELEKEMANLTQKLKSVEESNSKMRTELDAARMSIKELQYRNSCLENGEPKVDLDKFLQGVQQRHDRELFHIKALKEEAECKYSAKDHKCEALQKEIAELKDLYKNLVTEKSDTINQLMSDLEESQRQCQKLLVNVDKGKEEKEELEKKIQKLQSEMAAVHADLRRYEAVAQLGLLGAEDSDSFTNMNQKSQPNNDLNARLRDELQRCLAGLRLKREEIKKLRSQLEERDNVIQKLREQETAYLGQADQIQKDAENLMEQLHRYQAAENDVSNVEKLKTQLSEIQSELTKVKAEKERLEGELLAVRQQSLEEKLRAIDKHSEEYIRWHDKAVAKIRQEANQQIQAIQTDFSARLNQAEKECIDVKQMYIQVCNSKEELLTLLENERKTNKEQQRQLEIEAKKHQELEAQLQVLQSKLAEQCQNPSQVEELKKCLEEERQKVRALELEVDTAKEMEKQNAEIMNREINKAKLETIAELQAKYKQSNPVLSDMATSPMKFEKTENEETAKVMAAVEARHQEHLEQVKQESVQCLANELSACEARHRQQLERAEEEYSRSLSTFKSLIDSKTQEVEVLKKAMLEERDKLRAERENCQYVEELKARNEQIEQLEKRLQQWENEWQMMLSAQASEWRAKLTAYQNEVESERDKMAEAIAGWAEELQKLRKQQQEAETKAMESHNKYKAAKKVARRYKMWADGKEKHVEQEWHRISLAFQNALEALHAKAAAALAHSEGDVTLTKQLEAQIQDLQSQVAQYNLR